MRNLSVAAALLTSGAVFAATDVDRMVAQCHAVMVCEACKVTNAPAPAGATVAVFVKGKVYRVPATAIERLRAMGYAKNAAGEFEMCAELPISMRKPESADGLAARVLFSGDYDGRAYCPAPRQASVWERVYAFVSSGLRGSRL